MNRREFSRSAFFACSLSASASGFPAILKAGSRQKQILVLGGTRFLGPAFVEAALVAGHEVTLFNRGVTNPELFPRLEKLRGVRSSNPQEQNLSSLSGRHWDAVVDVWPSDPELVGSAARFLKDRAEHYVFVSSCAVYETNPLSPAPNPAEAEDWPLCPFDSSATGGRRYQVDKAESERRLRAVFADRATVVRPAIIKGYRDYGGEDLAFHLVRTLRGGRRIAPGSGDDCLQFIDVRDVGRFLVRCVDEPVSGTFNVAGEVQTLRGLLETTRAVTHSDAEFVWIPQTFLHEHGLEPGSNFPFWYPGDDRERLAREAKVPKPWGTDCSRAKRAGLRRRPVEETITEHLEWFLEDNSFHYEFKFLPSTTEADVLRSWETRAGLATTSQRIKSLS
jgi:2'-hydroxyisoflavone reductase